MPKLSSKYVSNSRWINYEDARIALGFAPNKSFSRFRMFHPATNFALIAPTIADINKHMWERARKHMRHAVAIDTRVIVIETVSQAFGIHADDIRGMSRDGVVVHARHCVIALLWWRGYSERERSAVVNKDRSTLSCAMRKHPHIINQFEEYARADGYCGPSFNRQGYRNLSPLFIEPGAAGYYSKATARRPANIGGPD